MHVLAIDLGTGGPKVALIDETGVATAWTSRPVATAFVAGGGAEQDPEEMWRALVDAARDVLRDDTDIAAIAVTSQYMSTVPVAADGTPVGPCVLWMDTRGAAHNLTLLTDESFMLFAERHGLIPLPSGNDGIAHIAALRDHHPQTYAAAAYFVEPMDYVNARLTGVVQATQSTMFSQLVCDNRTWGLTHYDLELVAATQLDPVKLPPLAPMDGFVGELSRAAAAELGLRAGIPLVPATIDSITSAVGAGALTAADISVIIGTTAVAVTHVASQRNDLGSGLLTVPSPVRDSYYVMAENGLGGRALQWAHELLSCDLDTALAAAATAPPGCDGAMFAPWLNGSIAPAPNDEARGAWLGLSLRHGRGHALRAVLEGVAANLAWLLPEVGAFTGAGLPELVRFGGGGAQSDLWSQILADAIDIPVRRLAQPRVTNARGAAFLALAELGVLDLADTPSMLRTESIHEPNPANRAVMDDVQQRLRAAHAALSQ
jgi:xylulokinase